MTLDWLAAKLTGGALMAALAWPAVADEPKPPAEKPAAEKPASDASEKGTEKKTEEKPDPFVVPDGSPKELMEFVKGLRKEIHDYETFQKFRAAALKTAEKILAGKPEDSERDFAIETKIQFSMNLDDLTKLAEELKQNGPKKFVRPAMTKCWQMKLGAAEESSPEEIKSLVKDALQFLVEEPLQSRDMGVAMSIGQVGENTKDESFIVDTYQKIAKMFKETKDEKLQKFGKQMEGVARRLTLLGKKIELAGKLLNGETLDMSKFDGKVVLVDFWATWCGPCVGEVPNVLKNYERYHEKGFEVIGVSLDRSREPLEKFIQEKKIPWATLYEDKPNPAVDYYGIMYIPTTLLVGKDGKVVSLSARGEELDNLLEKYLGPVEEKDKNEAEKKEKTDKS